MIFKCHNAGDWNREPLLHTHGAIEDDHRTHALEFVTKQPPPAELFALLETMNAAAFLGAAPGHLLFDCVIVSRAPDADAPADPLVPLGPEHFSYTLACSFVESRRVRFNQFYVMPPEGRPYLVESHDRAAVDLAAYFGRHGFRG